MIASKYLAKGQVVILDSNIKKYQGKPHSSTMLTRDSYKNLEVDVPDCSGA